MVLHESDWGRRKVRGVKRVSLFPVGKLPGCVCWNYLRFGGEECESGGLTGFSSPTSPLTRSRCLWVIWVRSSADWLMTYDLDGVPCPVRIRVSVRSRCVV